MDIMTEETTLEAINEIGAADKPYAAAMLCYVMIERCLKIYLFHHRTEKAKFNVTAVVRDKKPLSTFVGSNDKDFVKKCLTKIDLRRLEKIFRVNHKISRARNHLMHSNIYIVSQKDKTRQARHNENLALFKKARQHLCDASGYFEEKIIERNHNLFFERGS